MILNGYFSILSICRGPLLKEFIFILDSAVEIYGYGAVYSASISILSDFDTERITNGINFVDRKNFPEYTEDDFKVHNGYKVTTELRTLLDLIVINDQNIVLEYFDDLLCDFSMEEIRAYMISKNCLDIFEKTVEDLENYHFY